MFKKAIFFITLFTLPLVGAISPPKVEMTGPLEEKALKALVSGNSALGTTHSSDSLYELYFDPDGTLYFRKNSDNNQVHIGTWWITGKVIHSKWPTYEKKPTENSMHYYHLYENSYVFHPVNDPSQKPETFSPPFLMIKGKHSFVDEVLKKK